MEEMINKLFKNSEKFSEKFEPNLGEKTTVEK